MFGSLLLGGGVLLAQAATADVDLQLEVRRLVRQLNAPQLAQRETAEQDLLKLGPPVLDLLPRISDRTPAEVKQRLGRVRQKLQQAVAESAVRPSRITLHGEAVPLSEAIAALEKQSGNKIVDFRRQFGQPTTDPPLQLDFDDVPFWEALDGILDRAELSVYGFGEQGAISLVARSTGQLPRSEGVEYSGPLRFEPIRIIASRDLRDPAGESLRLTLAVAWEPRLKPIRLTQRMADLSAIDQHGDPLALDDSRAELNVPTGGAASVELTLPLKLPPRQVTEIASLRGKLLAMIPGKVETFTFSDLLTAKNLQQRTAGVTVTLVRVRRNNTVWQVDVRVRFDEAGGALASHLGWIYDNDAYLEDPDGKPIAYDSQEFTRQAKNEVAVAYIFVLKQPPENHKFIYKTPAVIVATEFDYEIKGVKLP